MDILDLRAVKKHFGHTVALDGVDLTLKKGEAHALIGENGAGKSTLMNVLAGAFAPDSGSMILNGNDYAPANTTEARRSGIALIHQELSLAPHLTVAENILMGKEDARWGWIDKTKLERRADAVLSSFSHPDIRPDMQVSQLSTAAQQVVEICRAIAANAQIILMDEPTSSLQRADVKHLFKLIRDLQADGISIIYISHFLEEVREIANSFTVVRDGKSVSTGRIEDVDDEFLITQMVGRSVDQLFPERSEARVVGEVALNVEDLSSLPVVENASFQLRYGEVLGIAGLMGAGRSEMVRAILGLETADGGAIIVSDGPANIHARPGERLSQGFGYLSENRKDEGLAVKLSIADNMTMTRFSTCSRWGWLDLKGQARQSTQLIRDVGVRASSATQAVETLSGGNQQKVAVARLIHQDANILLLDEPTRGIDIGSRAKIYEIIAGLADRGKAVVMISSYLPELFGMCDRLAVMCRGKLSPAKPIADWTPESVLQTAIEA